MRLIQKMAALGTLLIYREDDLRKHQLIDLLWDKIEKAIIGFTSWRANVDIQQERHEITKWISYLFGLSTLTIFLIIFFHWDNLFLPVVIIWIILSILWLISQFYTQFIEYLSYCLKFIAFLGISGLLGLFILEPNQFASEVPDTKMILLTIFILSISVVVVAVGSYTLGKIFEIFILAGSQKIAQKMLTLTKQKVRSFAAFIQVVLMIFD